MIAHWYDYLQMFAAMILYPAIAITLLERKQVSAWRGLFAVAIIETLKTATCLPTLQHLMTYKLYFYVYYSAQALLAVAGLAVLADLLRNIPLASQTPRFARLTLTIFGCVCAAVLLTIALLDKTHRSLAWVNLAMQLEHCTAIAWAAATAATLLRMPWMGFAWTKGTLQIAIGFTLRVTASSVITFMQKDAHKKTYILLAFALDTCNTLIAAYWLKTLTQPREVLIKSAELPYALQRFIVRSATRQAA